MASSPSFYLDENVAHELAARLQAGGFDVLTARDAGQLRSSDENQLGYAAEAKRILVTHNAKDFSRIAAEWASMQRHHSGIILAPMDSPSDLVVAISELIALYPDAGDWTDITVYTTV